METRTIKMNKKQSSEHNIPKVIHYCWFGRNPLPKLAQKCIDSWREYLPDYEIKEWNEDNFDVAINTYTKQAYEAKKYAFVSDFARLWILHNYGGVYFDVDVEVIKPMDDILRAGPFMGCERDGSNRINPGLGIATAPGFTIYKELLDSYKDEDFIKTNGKFNTTTIVDRTTDVLKKHGLQDIVGIQQVAGITIYPTEFFCPKSFDTGKLTITKNTRSIHWYDASWLPWYKKMYQPLKHLLPEQIRTVIQKSTGSNQSATTEKKVGILTFQHDNYGTRLQNYALARVVKSLGFTPISIISRHPKELVTSRIRKIQSMLLPFGEKSARWQDARLKNKIFKQFVEETINPMTVSRKGLHSLGQSLYMVIAGSDQIWNPAHLGRYRNDMLVYFLKFVPKEKRIAYAPSFGQKSIPDILQGEYSKNIKEFKSLSVRENDGQKIIHKLVGDKVEIVPDPTFLLSKNDWHELTDKYSHAYSEKEYIAIYFLSHQNESLLQSIRQFASDNKLIVIDIAGNTHTENQIVPAPDEFLAIIQNASIVFTDSFHGAVFSITLNTPFIVYDRTDHDQSSRIETLLKTYQLESVYSCDPSNWKDAIKQENFSHVENILSKEREKGLAYLKKALGNSHEK